MLVVSWNVNSLKVRAEYVSMFLDAVQPDVLGLQELKLDAPAVPIEIFESRGYHVAMCAQKQWNGVLLASKTPLEDIVTGLSPADQDQARLVAATTRGVRFVNLYCPQGQSVESEKFPYKLGFYDALIEWLPTDADLTSPVVVMGDLNIAPEDRDIYDTSKFEGIPSFHPEEHARWARLVELGRGRADVVENGADILMSPRENRPLRVAIAHSDSGTVGRDDPDAAVARNLVVSRRIPGAHQSAVSADDCAR